MDASAVIVILLVRHSSGKPDNPTWLFFVGMVVLRVMSFVKTPPSVSIPSESGVTSRSRTSVTSPARTPAWKTDAPADKVLVLAQFLVKQIKEVF